MSGRLLLLGLALCGMAHAATPRIELAVAPALKGWARPGRATEVDIRLSADAATRTSIDVTIGPQTVHAELDLQPGRVVRLQIPVRSAEAITVSAGSPGGPPQRRDIAMALSESPLLGLGLGPATDDRVQLEGFHTVAFAADDLPRNALAYSSIDALILDAQTLGALDQRQLAALLAHAAECGRIVVLNTDPGVRRVLDGQGGCGGQALMSAASLSEARQMLETSLAANLPQAISRGGIGELDRPGQVVWNQVAAALAVYFAAAVLAVLFFPSLPVLLLVPAVATAAILTLLHAMQTPSQLIVWSEGDSGAKVARYQAWQRFPGAVRERTRVPVPAQLASSARPCEPAQAMRLDFDAGRGRATFAEFETRLFRQVSLCYSGNFPMSRAIAMDARADGTRDIRNTGTMAWPHGVLLAGGLEHDLPALGPGGNTIIGAKAGRSPREAAVRTVMMRTRPERATALWALELGGVSDLPAESKGWFLMSIPAP